MDCLSILVCVSLLSLSLCLSVLHFGLHSFQTVFIRLFLIFNSSILFLSSATTLLFFQSLSASALYSTSFLSLHYIYTFVIIFASLSLIPPPPCLLPSLPLFSPLPLPPTLRWRGVNMSSTCGLIVLSQQSKTTTLKLLNRLHQMTSTSSLLPFFTLSPPFGLRCLTTMKQCLAGRIRQEKETETRKERKEERERPKKR